MPKDTSIKKILLIGSGPIVIGQGCEFDYSGVQACKALREEGYEVVLVNSNPATIMTDPGMADATYIEPVTWQVVEKVIEKERPDVLLPTMGGQTALNCALDLAKHGVLEKYGVEMIGANDRACTGSVVDHDWLTPLFLELLANRTTNDIVGAAGWEWYDQSNRAGGERLSSGG